MWSVGVAWMSLRALLVVVRLRTTVAVASQLEAPRHQHRCAGTLHSADSYGAMLRGWASPGHECRSYLHTALPQKSEAKARTPDSTGERILRLIGRLGGFYSRKAVLSRSAKTLYESCIDTINYKAFFQACNLPDSFQSWFLVAQLHVWLCLVRLKREGRDGDFLIKKVVSMFWYDVEQRMKVLGVHSSRVMNKSLKELLHEFYGLTLAYEEGLLNDDRTLAAAVWRNLIHDKTGTDAEGLAAVVEYIRSQVKHMDELDTELLLRNGNVKLLPFNPS